MSARAHGVTRRHLSLDVLLARPRARFDLACAGLACLLLLGCAVAKAPHFELAVRVESDPGQPLAGATIVRDGRALAQTDARGVAELRLAGAPGEVVSLAVSCPEGHRAPDKPLSIALKPLAEHGRRPEYRAACLPLLRSVVVAVRAQNGPNLPVKYLGKEIARTDAAGACHALLKVPPGETVTLTLDTSAAEHAKLTPRSPELRLTVPERDELIVFDQSFTRELEKRVRQRKKQVGPTRI
jgi:hypothetical protein